MIHPYTRDNAVEAAYGTKWPKATAKITEHWIHLRTSNPIILGLLEDGVSWAWASATSAVVLGGGAALVVVQARVAEPLLPLWVLRRRAGRGLRRRHADPGLAAGGGTPVITDPAP